jgi:hypothetical protein
MFNLSRLSILVLCPFLGQVFGAMSQAGAVNWIWVIAAGFAASVAVFATFVNEGAAPQAPVQATTVPMPTPKMPWRESLIAGAMLAVLVYLLYQVYLLIQAFVLQDVLPSVSPPIRDGVAAAAQAMIFVQTQMLLAVLCVVLGAVVLHRGRYLLPAIFAAAATLVLLTLLPHLFFVALGWDAHLAGLRGARLSDIAQGLLLSWSLLLAALLVGGGLTRGAALLRGLF